MRHWIKRLCVCVRESEHPISVVSERQSAGVGLYDEGV